MFSDEEVAMELDSVQHTLDCVAANVDDRLGNYSSN